MNTAPTMNRAVLYIGDRALDQSLDDRNKTQRRKFSTEYDETETIIEDTFLENVRYVRCKCNFLY